MELLAHLLTTDPAAPRLTVYNETTGARLVFRGRSPAIDAGDPAADYTSEPPPNGRRLNLGFYGGTPWATRTAFGGMCIIIR